jgi:hypothetical protein
MRFTVQVFRRDATPGASVKRSRVNVRFPPIADITSSIAYLLTHDTAIMAALPADIDGFSRYRALSILNAS